MTEHEVANLVIMASLAAPIIIAMVIEVIPDIRELLE